MKKIDGRSVIKQSQIDVLEVLYKYRFGSRSLLAGVLQVNDSTLYKKLTVLIKHELVGSRLDNSSKIKGLPTAYFLTPKGLRYLASLDKHDYITEKVIKASYRDKSLQESTITHCLDVFAHVVALKSRYPSLKAYLRRDMSRFNYFPESYPDAFLSLAQGDITQRFFLNVVPAAQEKRAVFQRVSTTLSFFDTGGWEATHTELPKLLFIAENGSVERSVRRIVKGIISNLEPDKEPEVYTTTQKALQHMDDEALIWTALDDDEPISLADIA